MRRKFGFKEGGTANVLLYLGETYRCLDEYAEAEACYRESLAMKQEAGAGSSDLIADNINLGYTVLYRGDDKQAVSFFKEALALSKERENKEELVACLAGFASVTAARGNAEASTLLYGVVESQVQALLSEGIKFESLITLHNGKRRLLNDNRFETEI